MRIGWLIFFLWLAQASQAQLATTYLIKVDPLAGLISHEYRLTLEMSIQKPRYFKPTKIDYDKVFKFNILDGTAEPRKQQNKTIRKITDKLSNVKTFLLSDRFPHYLHSSVSVYYYDYRWGPIFRMGIRNYFTRHAPEGPFAYLGLKFGLFSQAFYANGSAAPTGREFSGTFGLSLNGGWQFVFGHHRHFVLDGFAGAELDLPKTPYIYAGISVGFSFNRRYAQLH